MTQPPPTPPPPAATPPAGKPHWLTRPGTIRGLWWIGGGVLVLVTLAGKAVDIRPHFGIDGTFGFYGWYGFVTCVAMVLAAKALGVVLKRPEPYYDRR
jgi:hypothetical protein